MLGAPGSAARGRARNAINSLRAGGGTSICEGLRVASDALVGGPDGCLSAALLLTDGQDGGGRDLGRFDAALGVLRAQNARLDCFGFGADHDARLMGELAAAGSGGAFVYVESPESVGPAFGATLGALKSVVGRDFTVEVAVAAPSAGVGALAAAPQPPPHPPADDGMDLDPIAPGGGAGAVAAPPLPLPAHGGAVGGAALRGARTAYPATLSADGTRLRVRFGALSAAERRAVLLRVALPPLAPLPPAGGPLTRTPHLLLHATAHFSPLERLAAAQPSRVCAPVALSVTRAGGAGAGAVIAAAPRALAVEVAALREDAAGAMRAALRAAEGGRFAEAAAALDGALKAVAASAAAAAGDPFALELRADLIALKARVGSRAELEGGGGAALRCSMGSHTMQRSCGVASPGMSSAGRYATPAQALMSAASPRGGSHRGGARNPSPPWGVSASPSDPTAHTPAASRGGSGAPPRAPGRGPYRRGSGSGGGAVNPMPVLSPSAADPTAPAHAHGPVPPLTDAGAAEGWVSWLTGKAAILLGGGGAGAGGGGGGGAPLTPRGTPPGGAP